MSDDKFAEHERAFDLLEGTLKLVSSQLAELRAKVLADLAPTVPPKRLAVPWLSQLGPQAAYAPGDCGTACTAMLINYRGHPCTVDDVSKMTHRASGFFLLSFWELSAAATHFDVTLTYLSGATVEQMCAALDADKPSIVLVNYKSIPAANRHDMGYNSGHYIVLVGYDPEHVYYHDPYWPTSANGSFKRMTRAEFLTAYSTPAPGNTYGSHSLRLT